MYNDGPYRAWDKERYLKQNHINIYNNVVTVTLLYKIV